MDEKKLNPYPDVQPALTIANTTPLDVLHRMTAYRYTFIFSLVAFTFLPVFWFFFFDSYISPASGIFVSKILAAGLSPSIFIAILEGVFICIPYLAIFGFIGFRVHRRAAKITNRTLRIIIYIVPLIVIFSSSFLPVVRHDGWGGSSTSFTFWSAANRLLDKMQSL